MRGLERVTATVEAVLDRAGYEPIRTPMFERFALLAARAGDAVRQAMFTFTTERVEYALRPELTAPACRLLASGRLGEGPAHRVRYLGPCFRYEKPGSLRAREFTQIGCELFGVSGPSGDAEIVALASECLEAAAPGVAQIAIGSIRVLDAALGGLSPEQRALAAGLLHDSIMLAERCASWRPECETPERAALWLRDLTASVYRLQRRVGVGDGPAIEPPAVYTEEVVRDLVETLPRASRSATCRALADTAGLSSTVADALVEATTISGELEATVVRGAALLGPEAEPGLAELREVASMCRSLEVPGLVASLGVGRGLEFYTGIVMTITAPGVPAAFQLGGGGRYDSLVGELGGPATPAAGFALEVECLAACADASRVELRRAPLVAVLPVDDSAWLRASLLAKRVRAAGLVAPTPQPGVGPRAYAARVLVPREGALTVALAGHPDASAADAEALLAILGRIPPEGEPPR
jgi:histidyl-tRNA synthetase